MESITAFSIFNLRLEAIGVVQANNSSHGDVKLHPQMLDYSVNGQTLLKSVNYLLKASGIH